MPETAETLGLGFCLDDLGNVRKAIHAVGEHVILQQTEALGKIIVLPRCELLIAEEQDLVIEKGPVELIKSSLVKPDG